MAGSLEFTKTNPVDVEELVAQSSANAWQHGNLLCREYIHFRGFSVLVFLSRPFRPPRLLNTFAALLTYKQACSTTS
jgi:hypothetical protein